MIIILESIFVVVLNQFVIITIPFVSHVTSPLVCLTYIFSRLNSLIKVCLAKTTNGQISLLWTLSTSALTAINVNVAQLRERSLW